jgi:hypothetical protein
MKKVDTKLAYPEIYHPDKGVIKIIDIPKLRFLSIVGYGKPTEKNFLDATQTIYNIAYALKYLIRKEMNIDYKVMPLEVIWDLNNPDKEFGWTMMIMQPPYINQKLFQKSFDIVKASGKTLPLESEIRFTEYTAGSVIQALHIGPYDKMGETITRMKDYAEESELTIDENNHDIYLNDMRKTEPNRLKTVVLLKILK